jgi:hypothetical protein
VFADLSSFVGDLWDRESSRLPNTELCMQFHTDSRLVQGMLEEEVI